MTVWDLATHLLDHPVKPPIENIDRPTVYDPDTRQDSLMRALSHFMKDGIPHLKESELRQSLTEHQEYVGKAMYSANRNRYHAARRKGMTVPKKMTIPWACALLESNLLEDAQSRLSLSDVESGFDSEALDNLYNCGCKFKRRAIELLRIIQWQKDNGVPMTGPQREELRMLRKRTGLALLTKAL